MAIYHLSAKLIKRSNGRSSVAAAAYRAGVALRDERLEKTFDYRKKIDDVVHSELRYPSDATMRPERAELWNAVEFAEKRRDAQVAREIVVALPRELSRNENIALLREFIDRQFCAVGMIADVNLHTSNDGRNPHAHIMLTTREWQVDRLADKKERLWNNKFFLKAWRDDWAEAVNQRLSALGSAQRISSRSHAELGIDVTPTEHLGPKLNQLRRDTEHLPISQLVEKIGLDVAVKIAPKKFGEFKNAAAATLKNIDRSLRRWAHRCTNITNRLERRQPRFNRLSPEASSHAHRKKQRIL